MSTPPDNPAWHARAQTERANAARVDNVLLGGGHHFAPDRAVAAALLAADPDAGALVHAGHALAHQAVRHAAHHGVQQVLDLGCGLPHGHPPITDPPTRTVLVDHDPIVIDLVARSITDPTHATALTADLTDVQALRDHPAARRIIDWDRPVLVLLIRVLEHLPDPAPAVAALGRALAPGSRLALAHTTIPTRPADRARAEAAAAVLADATIPWYPRSPTAITTLMRGWRPLPPGPQSATGWQADGRTPPRRLPGLLTATYQPMSAPTTARAEADPDRAQRSRSPTDAGTPYHRSTHPRPERPAHPGPDAAHR